MKIHLICGYKRSGKDTFYKKINEGHIHTIEEDCNDSKSIPYFYILCKPGVLDRDFIFFKDTLSRFSLAKLVKEDIHKKLHIQFEDSPKGEKAEESAKDAMLFFDSEKNKFRYLRDFYIEHAMNTRNVDPEYWCKKVYESVKNIESSKDICITDWRFLNERIYFEGFGASITYRVFRQEANNNNIEDFTEHSLDHEITDFLVVGSLDDIKIAKQKFPVYKDYEVKFLLY